jgi:hypothetical protein
MHKKRDILQIIFEKTTYKNIPFDTELISFYANLPLDEWWHPLG